MRRITAGQQCKKIAAELGISTKTVEFHRASIARQLGIGSTAELTRWAITQGLTSPPTAGLKLAPEPVESVEPVDGDDE